jgi:hypothetical protein
VIQGAADGVKQVSTRSGMGLEPPNPEMYIKLCSSASWVGQVLPEPTHCAAVSEAESMDTWASRL